jgi:hypothetical protein
MRCDANRGAMLRPSRARTLKAATEQDWYEEYLAPIISIKVVEGVDEAIAHINRYSSHHTDAIITRDHMHRQRFLREVDSASVMVNASPRFADGFEFGLGAKSASAPTSSMPAVRGDRRPYLAQVGGAGQRRSTFLKPTAAAARLRHGTVRIALRLLRRREIPTAPCLALSVQTRPGGPSCS